jgi:hypothetical protein
MLQRVESAASSVLIKPLHEQSEGMAAGNFYLLNKKATLLARQVFKMERWHLVPSLCVFLVRLFSLGDAVAVMGCADNEARCTRV